MIKSTTALVSVLFMAACGTQETPNVIVDIPKPEVVEKEVIVEKPVIVEKEVVVYKEAPVVTETVTVCHVMLRDWYGNLYRLSADDQFLKSTELARQFTEAEADYIVEQKCGYVRGDVSKYCFEKEVVVKK